MKCFKPGTAECLGFVKSWREGDDICGYLLSNESLWGDAMITSRYWKDIQGSRRIPSLYIGKNSCLCDISRSHFSCRMWLSSFWIIGLCSTEAQASQDSQSSSTVLVTVQREITECSALFLYCVSVTVSSSPCFYLRCYIV